MKTIVQIGVADGNDHVFELIKNSEELIFPIFIEPNPYSIPLINNKYNFLKQKIISNVAISDIDGYTKMYFPPWFYTGDALVASLNKNHVISHEIPEYTIKTLEVMCFKLNTYLNTILGFCQENLINDLFIDTEGHDCDIILATDFSKINVNNICFEYIHSDGVGSGMNTKKFLNTNKHLENFGYYLQKIDKDNHNVIYTKK